MHKKVILTCAISGIMSLLLLGCTQMAMLIVTPNSVVLEPGGSVTFTATNSSGAPVPVTWAVSSGPGTITPGGVYTAPPNVTEVTNATITATRTGYPSITGFAIVTIKPPLTAGLIDPLGDAFGPKTYDIKSITTSRTSTTLTITLTFTTPTSIPSPGHLVGAEDLAGFITLDTDEDPATGISSANSFYCPSLPPSANGVDFFISLFFRNTAGNYDVYETTTFTDVGDATPTLVGKVLTLNIPLTALEGDDGRTYLNSVMGDDSNPTDCIPDEGAAVVTAKGIDPNPYRDFLLDLGITAPGWTQTPSFTL
ncbi:MAG: hypothetical protein ACUVRH_05950 [Candidatus Bipolaricaulia bacterium]